MGQDAPYRILDKLPPQREKIETLEILRETNKATAALAELKGIARSSIVPFNFTSPRYSLLTTHSSRLTAFLLLRQLIKFTYFAYSALFKKS